MSCKDARNCRSEFKGGYWGENCFRELGEMHINNGLFEFIWLIGLQAHSGVVTNQGYLPPGVG